MDTNTFNTTALQDELTGALVGLARAADTAPATYFSAASEETIFSAAVHIRS